MKKLFIIDLMPFLYRGHFVFLKSPRMTSTGINTSALLGFANGVTSILKDFSPTHAVLAMDPGGPTFRHEAYPPYKAQRQKMPEDLAASIPYAFELAEALRIPVLRQEGFEADDVMGTLAVRAAAEGFDVYLATPDKDAAQLGALGAEVEERPDGFTVRGGTLKGGTARANGDHRLAMSMAICGLRTPVAVEGAEILNESFPEFEPLLSSLR